MRTKSLWFLILAVLLSLSLRNTEGMLPPVAEAQGVTQFYLPWAAGKKLYVKQGNFGSFTHYQGSPFQYGWDFTQDEEGEPHGEPILAAADGIVRVADEEGRSDWGLYVVLEHEGSPRYSLYGHLGTIDAKARVGNTIRRGCPVGTLGMTGQAQRVNIAHLHFQFMDQLWVRSAQGKLVIGPSVSGSFVEGLPQQGQWAYSKNPPCGSIVAPAAATTILVIDVSGSMDWLDPSGVKKVEAARQAADLIVDMIEHENISQGTAHQIGIVAFSEGIAHELSPTTDMNEVRETISRLYPISGTNIALALRQANQQLSTISTGVKPIIVLLSDGVPTVDMSGRVPDSQAEFEALKDEVLSGPVSEAASRGYCIHTVGFGDPADSGQSGAISVPSVDPDFLRQVAQATGCGAYYEATDAYQLGNIYVKLRHQSTGTIIGEFIGQVREGETVTAGEATVPSGTGELHTTLTWSGSRLDMILTDPSARQVDENYPGASVSTVANLVYIIIKNPPPGLWQVAVFGAEVEEAATDFMAILSTREREEPLDTGGDIAIPLFLTLGLMAVVFTVVITSSQLSKAPSAPEAGLLVPGPPGGSPRFVSFRRTMVTIGRDSRNDLVLADPKVSSNHAQIRRTAQGYVVTDLRSTNGTFVNRRKISSQLLRNGDEIRLGDTRLGFRS